LLQKRGGLHHSQRVTFAGAEAFAKSLGTAFTGQDVPFAYNFAQLRNHLTFAHKTLTS
jgi:hypothetical protein